MREDGKEFMGIVVLRDIPSCVMIGKVLSTTPEGVTMSHLTMATTTGMEGSESESILTPAVLPLNEIGDGFGAECISNVLLRNTIIYSAIPLVKDSKHRLVNKFVKFWGITLGEEAEAEKVGEEAVTE